MEKLLVRPEEAADILALGRTFVYRLLAEGSLESVKCGRRRLIPTQALVAYVERVRRAQSEGRKDA